MVAECGHQSDRAKGHKDSWENTIQRMPVRPLPQQISNGVSKWTFALTNGIAQLAQVLGRTEECAGRSLTLSLTPALGWDFKPPQPSSTGAFRL